jgi:hypothetical protein
MGHMNRRQQNIRSTSKTPSTYDIEDVTVIPVGVGTNTHLVYAVLVYQGQLFTDFTGKCLLNYSHSRIPPRTRPHGRTDESKRPERHPTKECARACVCCL